MNNIRQCIRKIGIRCVPWRFWREELKNMPISSKTLFKSDGIPLDIWEIELKEVGLLFDNESLLEVLKNNDNLYRRCLRDIESREDSTFGDIPENWIEEDFEYYNNN